MKKLFTILALSLLCACCAFGFAACDNGKSVSEEENKQILEIYNMYVVYAEENGVEPKSYEEWLALIKGEKGDQGEQGEKGDTGEQGPQGEQGESGKSAYQIWLENGNTGTQADFLNWLKGQDGKNGKNGITPTIEISDDGFWIINGTKTEYKAIGQDGKDGKDGVNGKDGVGVKSTTIDSNGDLIITLTDNSVLNAGKVVVYENPQGLDFYLLPDGTYGVTCGTAYFLEEIVIPSIYRGKPVTQIISDGEKIHGFYCCPNLKYITIPDSITSIGEYAFYGCYNLTSITIPDSVTSIGVCAFDNCYGLTSITFDKNSQLTSIGDYAFGSCSSLTSIEIPDNVTSIGIGAFYNCPCLETANGLSYVGKWLVQAERDITSAVIKDDTVGILDNAFSACTKLMSIIVGENNKYYKSIDGNLYNKDGKTLLQCAPGKTETEFIIRDGVISIGNYAFYNCSSLTSITIPDSVTSIGQQAFYNCYNLTSVTFGNGVTSIGPAMFHYCRSLTSITIPDSVTSIGENAFGSCYNLTSITFNGTQEQWQAISKGNYWKDSVPSSCVVHCTDGDIKI